MKKYGNIVKNFGMVDCEDFIDINCGNNNTIICGDYCTIDCGNENVIECGSDTTVSCCSYNTINCGSDISLSIHGNGNVLIQYYEDEWHKYDLDVLLKDYKGEKVRIVKGGIESEEE